MAEVRLRRWRRSDLDDVAVMIGDEDLRPWSKRLGADRRSPTRVKIDRSGVPRTLVVYVLTLRSD
jgi:hypothetical protein